MRGTNAKTGRAIAGVDHLWQSVVDILTTQKGERIKRRDYGCGLPQLVDAPWSQSLRLDITAEIFTAIEKFEPRIKIEKVNVIRDDVGNIIIDLYGIYRPTGKPINLLNALAEK